MPGWDGLVEEAAGRGSTALAAAWAGGPVRSWSPDGEEVPAECMSVTKLVVGAVLGLAVEVEDLGRPLRTWIPEWDDERGDLTLRMAADHTSGLEVRPASDVYEAPSVEALTLSLGVAGRPGPYAYNNAAFHLVGIVIQRAAGVSMVQLAGERLFGPLGISDWTWQQDEQGFGLCMAGLHLTASDLARVGRLYLEGGGQVLPEAWVAATPPPADRALGICCYKDYAWIKRSDAGVEVGPVVGFQHSGDFGQYLTIQPSICVAAVRQRMVFDRDEHSSWADFGGAVHEHLGTP